MERVRASNMTELSPVAQKLPADGACGRIPARNMSCRSSFICAGGTKALSERRKARSTQTRGGADDPPV